MIKFILFLLIFPLITLNSTLAIEVELGQKTNFKVGDIFQLKNSKVSVTIGFAQGSECAVPGYNCGAGYQPPHPTYTLDCAEIKPCPYIVMLIAKSAKEGTVSIENEESCVKTDAKNCFYQIGKSFKLDRDCLKLTTSVGQYYCLEAFQNSALPEIKNLCEKLPAEIYALRWNCFYEYAVRFKDASFCEKYSNSKQDASGKNRCYLKMAELLKDKKLCQKITRNKDDSYLEQCESIK